MTIFEADMSRIAWAWERMAAADPYYTVLTDPAVGPGGWDGRKEEFYKTGWSELARVVSRASLDLEAARESHENLFRAGRALDFGCGVGRLTFALSHMAKETIGLDVSESMLTEARAQALVRAPVGHRDVRFQRYDGVVWPEDLGEFDLVVSAITLQHLPVRAQREVIGWLCGALAPGGVLAFGLPLEPLIVGRGGSIDSMAMFGQSPSAVVSLLRSRGLRVVGMHMDIGQSEYNPAWVTVWYVAIKPTVSA